MAWLNIVSLTSESCSIPNSRDVIQTGHIQAYLTFEHQISGVLSMTIHAQKTPEMGSKRQIDFLQMSFYILSYPNKRSAQRQRDTKQGSCMCSITLYPPYTLVFFRSDAKRTQLLSVCYQMSPVCGMCFCSNVQPVFFWLNLIQLDSGLRVVQMFVCFLVIQLTSEPVSS